MSVQVVNFTVGLRELDKHSRFNRLTNWLGKTHSIPFVLVVSAADIMALSVQIYYVTQFGCFTASCKLTFPAKSSISHVYHEKSIKFSFLSCAEAFSYLPWN